MGESGAMVRRVSSFTIAFANLCIVNASTTDHREVLGPKLA